MRRALPLLSLLFIAACASNDGFVDQVRGCGSGEPIEVEAGWETASSAMDVPGYDRRNMLVRVSNNSDADVTVKFIRVDPMNLPRDGEWEIEGGARDVDKVVAEAGDATFEIPMMSRRRFQNRGNGVRVTSLDVAVTVILGNEESVRCLFRVPLG